ncbi:tripartite motif-containing protein 42 [Pelodytes ibericus]
MPYQCTCCGAPCCIDCKQSYCVCCPGKCRCRRTRKLSKCETSCCECNCLPRPNCENCICEYREQKRCPGYFCLELTHPLCTCKNTDTGDRCKCCRPVPRGIIHKRRLEKSSSTDLKNAIIQQLTCPSCKQMYANPFILPCGHCLCQTCVDKTKIKDTKSKGYYFVVFCPVCETAHYFPSNEQIRLPENYLRAKVALKYGYLFKDRASVKLCDRCHPDHRAQAVLRCIICKINYCQKCLRFYHNKKEFEEHILTEKFWEGEDIKNCFHHPLMPIVEYCMTDKTLICVQCKHFFHEKHDCLPLSEASTQEAHALFSSIAKFKRVKCRFENDLMEINLVNDDFKGYKENKKREIKNGFIRLHDILSTKEKEILGSVQNIEQQKHQYLVEYLSSSNEMLLNIEGIMQYSKEALKEENPVTFLQSANALVQELENDMVKLYQPHSSLKNDPICNVRLNFDQIASSLHVLFPQPKVDMKHISDHEKLPYLTESLKNITSSFGACALLPSRSSLSLKSTDSVDNRTDSLKSGQKNIRAKSTPPVSSHSMEDVTETTKKLNVATPIYPPFPRETPGPVTIYQVIVYPNAAKIYWTSPPETVDFYDVEFQEFSDADSTDSKHMGDLIGKIYGIKKQNVELHNLSPSSEYIFRVRGVNLAGEGEWSEVMKIETSENPGSSSYSQRIIQRIATTSILTAVHDSDGGSTTNIGSAGYSTLLSILKYNTGSSHDALLFLHHTFHPVGFLLLWGTHHGIPHGPG